MHRGSSKLCGDEVDLKGRKACESEAHIQVKSKEVLKRKEDV